MSLTELSKKLGLGKSSVYRLLVTLVLRGYVDKDPDSDRYRLTYRLFAADVVVPGCLAYGFRRLDFVPAGTGPCPVEETSRP